MQKQITMNVQSILWAVFKPALRRKFNFKEILKCNFVANTIEDSLELSATGFIKNDLELKKYSLPTLKLSEHNEYLNMFTSKIDSSGAVKYKKINVMYFNVDFENKIAETTLFYINMNDVKDSIKIKLKL